MSRRLGRETALQTLFQHDLGRVDLEFALKYTCEEFSVNERAAEFAQELVRGVADYRKEIDQTISRLAVEWNLDRLANVDRNLLRLAIFEILYRSDVPNNVAINEALELAKIYSGEEAAKFINGVLGQLARELQQKENKSSPSDHDDGQSVAISEQAGTEKEQSEKEQVNGSL
ncbi:transcription antitermination factor NusB [Heliorestis acidaminivorans]|uniref:Transcription antitermination protein NusB n=1 Tax=Heliorestis acidaminivorans TaxID=553427 RepID=A0A6I0F3G3_9FIRM|nr:transcription antitermination factor NusB [Heliorestis acidaminivorans]KAB2951680.1 transcription antitermination factor NusB [Heliorestis acidaminivorans]